MRFISLTILFSILICYVNSTASNIKPEIKKKMSKLSKDLYNADFSDLQRLGINYVPKTRTILGRGGTRLAALTEDAKDAVPGKCDPKPVCISNPLIENITSTQFAFPPCINIHRCEGCCGDNEKCVPIGTHEVKLQKVGIIDIVEGNGDKFSETTVSVLNHTDCQCQCQWQSDEDCKAVNPNYVKSEYGCECVCPQEKFCGTFWEFDSNTCSCKCRKANFGRLEQACKLNGHRWNDQSCKCETIRISVNHKEIRINN